MKKTNVMFCAALLAALAQAASMTTTWGEAKGWPHGRGWPTLAEMPEGCPYRYLMLTMDRINYPGIPDPNWTYGAIFIYGANLQEKDKETK